MNRRQFVKNSAAASAFIAGSSFEGIAGSQQQSRSLKKGIMWECINTGGSVMDMFKAAKDAGFEGVEVMSHMNRDEVLKARDATGMVIPSVCGAMHWKYFLSDPDPEIRAKGVEALKLSIEDAAFYGADTVLLVPGKVTDKVSYDECWTRSVDEIRKALPDAVNKNVKIAVENVWNNFIISPMEAASYVDQFRTPHLGFYFDCGNVLVYGWPEQWIKILNKRIAKIHIKEFSRKIADTQGKSAGFNVKLTEGDVDWPMVMKALGNTGYNGWTIVEQPGGDTPAGLSDLGRRLDKIHSL